MTPALLSRPAIGSFNPMISAGCPAGTQNVGQVADNRNGVAAFFLDVIPKFIQPSWITPNQNNGSMPGQLKGCGPAYAGGRASNDVSFFLR